MNLSVLAPSFNCAAKCLKLPGSIWGERKPTNGTWQGVSEQFPVETCACLCKNSRDLPRSGTPELLHSFTLGHFNSSTLALFYSLGLRSPTTPAPPSTPRPPRCDTQEHVY